MGTSTPRPDPWSAGTVTRSDPMPVAADPALTGPAPTVAGPGGPALAGPPPDQRRRDRRTLLWFGGAAAGVLVTGLVIVLAMLLAGERGPLRRQYAPPRDNRPPLARLCPPPSGAPAVPPRSGAVPVPSGPRTLDRESGISYREYGDPWVPWRDRWSQGALRVTYAVGQHFVTEEYDGGTYHASILSGRVPATVNDAVAIDLACTGRQVAADVRTSYYPQPTRMEPLRDEQAVLGGMPAWVTTFRLHFNRTGLRATSELVGVALIDIGQPEAAVLYVSIPNTHAQFDWVVEDVLASVRPL